MGKSIFFSSGVFLMRSLGCVANDIADRKWDGQVKRTQQRPLATQAISLNAALVLQLNRFTFQLAWVGLGLTLIYPYAKRFTYWPQVILGLTFSWGIPMAFAAQINQVPLFAWLLYVSASSWPLAYDTIYAMVDREDDQKVGIKSTAIRLYQRETQFIAAVQMTFILSLFGLGRWLGFSSAYYVGLLGATGLFVYQQYLIQERIPEHCFKAFLNNAWVGALIFLGIYFGMPS
ncbi:4-hydroxybenzoate octaprenyltransferase [Rickettsiella massiliensis]|uniref:4-hydroxybenzoate octaprenyltransferase n=1 Tax=Rickettsiella massiliensis TaxID=676517 RepID=UPI0002DF3961|nr:4-hydroxybenzoate octaprenyltransferase [Rickettsiella massiliensis]